MKIAQRSKDIQEILLQALGIIMPISTYKILLFFFDMTICKFASKMPY